MSRIRTVTLCDGKYEFDLDLDQNARLVDVRRHSEHWEAGMVYRFNKSVMAMLHRIIELEDL